MNSIGEACNDLKKEYDACFNTWFSEHFLRGSTNDSMCAPLFKVYQQCVKKAMKDQKIDLQEVSADVLGGSKEKKIENS
ncbi:TP53-regulated inhibitor of apoptosis 1-like [Diorhabda carinulata]|uniref:TP53-regulated inhibitor of apoptosis 1-like n=1 Tax=Diorhabda sublineata TaxID=1163346 RepID=UPI0024E06DF6|nr:TP53-regulated inhibitor of apoptosis 1-like [Diorhabda sublineata]XP_057667665.1 TP53-regulated inhibitor of apoptosis 1-like [Diorhabda carinulata]